MSVSIASPLVKFYKTFVKSLQAFGANVINKF